MGNGRRRILAGDIGGTKTLLQIAEFRPGQPRAERVVREARFESAAFDSLRAMIGRFLEQDTEGGPLHGAAFGVAGPVRHEEGTTRAQLTNLPWTLDATQLGKALDLDRIRLVNDFAAIGYGIDALDAEDLTPLQIGSPVTDAPRLVLGAGTGLGAALLFPCGGRYEVFPTEAGHGDFAPGDELQAELLAHLRREHGRVSHERVVSGPGLAAIYRFLVQREGEDPAADPLLAADDPGAAIGGDDSPRARQAMALFIAAYGSVAGTLALTVLAHGGVYVAGGIAPKILPRLREGGFVEAFNDKGRMRPLTRAMPIHVITNPKVGLLGAAAAANRL